MSDGGGGGGEGEERGGVSAANRKWPQIKRMRNGSDVRSLAAAHSLLLYAMYSTGAKGSSTESALEELLEEAGDAGLVLLVPARGRCSRGHLCQDLGCRRLLSVLLLIGLPGTAVWHRLQRRRKEEKRRGKEKQIRNDSIHDS